MLPTERRPVRTVRRCQTDRAAVVLLRLVADPDDWDREDAALELRGQFDDVRLLHLLRARVAHAMLDRPTPTDLRALATLERALFAPRRAQAHADTGPLAVVAP
jgi:hypothetical protein